MTFNNVLIGQAGGPTAVINQSLWGVVSTLYDSKKVGAVLGARQGVAGVLKGDLIDLRATGRRRWKSVAQTPGAALGSVRHKPTEEECARILEQCTAFGVRHFVYIGGNDSAETAMLLSSMARTAKRELSVWHVPKTIDNDLRVTDHCPGYGSAARFVACAFLGDEEDNRSLGGVKINVVMGRDAGWLTAASVLARRHEDAGPHLIYVPERPFSLETFANEVDAVVKRIGRCVVAVSEGVRDAAGKPIVNTSERDSHGNLQLSGSGQLGDQLAAYLKGKLEGGSVALLRREGKKRYEAECALIDLARVAKVTRPLEAQFLAGNSDVTPEFAAWLSPLVGDLPVTERLLHKSWTR